MNLLRLFTVLIAFAWSNAHPVTETVPGGATQDTLSQHFKKPPPEYSLVPFWSLNNTLDSNKLNWQIDQMLDKGVYGAFMHARDGLDQSATPYFSDGWWTAIEAAVKHAHAKGFYTHLYDEDKWPSGSAGGRTIQANPERNIKKILRYNEFQVLAPQTIQLNFVANPVAIYAGRITDRGVYDFSSQVDLTSLAGKEWKAPAGRWSIIVFNMIKDPENQVNYMDSSTVADFIHITHDEYYRRLGSYFGNTIPGVFFDEIYANSRERRNNIFWSDDLLQQFKRIKGYDLKPYLSLLILNDPKLSPAKRFDFFDVVRIVYGNAWFTQYAKWAADHKIWVTGHTTEELIQYIRQSDYFFTEGQLQVPCTDNEDFRYGFPRTIDFYNPKQISSIGHLYGRKRVAAEALGSGGYTIPLEEYRYGFSMLGVYGVNSFIPHLFHYSMDRPENQADWAPSWFYQNPYWKYFKPLANFAQRISYMLSQGKHMCKVAIVYPLTQAWLGGYSTPVSDDYYREVQRILVDSHIDYDVIDPYSLVNATVGKQELQAGSGQYQVLVLPGLSAIQSEGMRKIRDFTNNGGIVVGLKELPSASEKGTPVDPDVLHAMTDIFGFQPKELGQAQYHMENEERTDRVITRTNAAGGKGIFTRYLEELPGIIHHQTATDLLMNGAGNEWLKHQHRQVGGKDVYYFMNSEKTEHSFKVSLSQVGKPQLWDPETGAITDISNYRIYNNRLEMQLEFASWQSYFVVITPAAQQPGTFLLTKTDLTDPEIERGKDNITISGWSTGTGKHQVEFLKDNTLLKKEWHSATALPVITVKGNWDFQLSPKTLNDHWTANPGRDTLALSVMKFKSQFNHNWKTIKVEDTFSGIAGATRYLGSWDAAWISYYDNSMHLAETGGGTVYFKKEIDLTGEPGNSLLDITADERYELFINGKIVGANDNWKDPVRYNIREFIRKGKNTILIKTTNTKGLLLQASINLTNGENVLVTSDESWQASKDQVNWRPALNYVQPPLGSWGNISRPGITVNFPCNIEYEQELPPGSEAIVKPVIKGNWEIFVNGQLLNFAEKSSVNISRYLKGKKDILSIHVSIDNYAGGLQKRVEVVCGKTQVPLGPWSDNSLGWYSGRTVYTHSVELDAAYCRAGSRLVIDLGQVNHFAEIWVNDQLVTYRAWAPFTADLTKFIHPGKNKISIVVANLLANEAMWNMMDANIDNKDARWWNFGSIMREKEKLVSGLIGPVQLVPYVKASFLVPRR